MRLKREPTGFTIVEALIVLSIMSLLFFLLVSTLTTNVKRVSFNTAVQDFQRQIQSYIDEASEGQYNSDNVSCSGSTANSIPYISDTATQHGANPTCEYVGYGFDMRHYNESPSGAWLQSVLTLTPLAMSAPTGYEPILNLSQDPPLMPLAPVDSLFTGYTGSLGTAGGGQNETGITNGLTTNNTNSYLEGDLNFVYTSSYPNYLNPTPPNQLSCKDPFNTAITYEQCDNNFFFGIAYSPFNSVGSSTNGAVGMAPYLIVSPLAFYLMNQTPISQYCGSGPYGSPPYSCNFFNNTSLNWYYDDYYYDAYLVPVDYIQLCFDSGTSNESVLYTLSSGSSTNNIGMTVSDQIFQVLSC